MKIAHKLNIIRTAVDTCLKVDVARRSRWRDITDARHIYFQIARMQTGAPLMTIAKSVGMHHSSVIYGIKKCSDLKQFDANFRIKYEIVLKEVEKQNESII